jgi:hypothetical protein
MTRAQWFTTRERNSSPIARAVLGDCELSVRYLGDGKWRWLVDKDGRVIAAGAASNAADASEQAEVMAIAANANLS